MSGSTVAVEHEAGAGAAVVRLRGDLTLASAGAIHGKLRALAARPGLREVTVDFGGAGRVDSSGIAVVSLARRELERRGARLEVTALDERQRIAFEQLSRASAAGSEAEADASPPDASASPGSEAARSDAQRRGGSGAWIERVGERVLGAAASARAFLGLAGETLLQTAAVAARRERLPAGAISRQIAAMGADGVPIIVLLSCMLGTTIAFQTILQLQRFGAGVFVADAIGLSMVRELSPLMSAIILTGRTGAAIAAELGTMRVRSEIDALSAMGISPVRFLVVPRMLAITLAGPALALISMAVAIAGGMFIAASVLDMPPVAFLARVTERVRMGDLAHGMSKSLVFAWIVGFCGVHLGMRAGGDARSVGAAATRTVVAGISLIILVDAIFATVSSLWGPR